MSKFSFQAIHNFASGLIIIVGLSNIYVKVLFSSNSQPPGHAQTTSGNCQISMSKFSFQAIHNANSCTSSRDQIVKYLCQSSLFKQFTTACRYCCLTARLSNIYVKVLFSSNSQHSRSLAAHRRHCQISMSKFSFQAIHNHEEQPHILYLLSNIYVKVLFSSNSQPFSYIGFDINIVKYLCQSSLFKQFTTGYLNSKLVERLSNIYVKVLFSSNSQPFGSKQLQYKIVKYLCQSSLFKQFTTAA